MRFSFLLPVALCCALLTACGSSEEDKITESLDSFQQAVTDKDKKAFCEAVTSEQLKGSGACEKQVKASDLESIGEVKDIKAEDIKVNGDKATATVSVTVQGKRNSDEAEFRKVDGDWKIVLD
jgi:Domain of unknown function (DUF4878)